MLTLVLLPGMDGTGTLFAPFIDALGSQFSVQVVAYPTTGALGYAELEQYARAHLPKDRRFVILGESFSGPIALSLAASGPPGLEGVVLCSTFACNPRSAFGWMLSLVGVLPVKLAPTPVLSALLLGRFSTPLLRSQLAAAMSKVSAQALRARLRAVLSIDVSAQLAAINVPVLYLLAEHDLVVPVSALQHIRRHLPAVQVAAIDAPHFLLQAAPAEATRAIGEFVHPLQDVI